MATLKDSLVVEQAQEWIKRRIYRNSTEYSEYIKQRFQDRTGLSFEFDGHRWQYDYSLFDDTGEYDIIHRPPEPTPAADRRRLYSPVQIAECGGPCTEGGPDACDCGALVVSAHVCADTALPAPAPAADRPLWAQMATTYDETPEVPEDWAAVLDVVAAWLAAREHCGAASALRTEARRAREGA